MYMYVYIYIYTYICTYNYLNMHQEPHVFYGSEV